MQQFYHRTWAEVDLDKIENNIKHIQTHLKPETKIIGVIKADAYGHGACATANILDKYVSMFALSSIDEVLQLRKNNINKPMLVLGYTPIELVETLIRNNITQTVFSYDYAEKLYQEAKNYGRKLNIHIKLDTGMTRLGFDTQSQADIDSSARQIIQAYHKFSDFLQFDGLFTHFAISDEPEQDFTNKQFDFFCQMSTRLKREGIPFHNLHVCNSAAIINYPAMHLDMVRPGIILYGLKPDKKTTDIGLSPALSLKTVVSQIHTVKKGATISYGRTYKVNKDTTIATLPIGYADGYSRLMSNGGQVLVNGLRAPIVGRICMDQCMIDITPIKNVKQGDIVTLIGKSGNDEINVEEIADRMGTINYEVTCLIGKRVPRVYMKDGKETSIYTAI